jgi:hypothetical protein
VDPRRPRLIVVVGLAVALLSAAPGAYAQASDDPASVVDAYSTALNAHDLPAALALFDQNGSATDAQGRHYQGRDELTDFLLANGFESADTRVLTNQVQVFGNRALWTYSCSCTSNATDVRVVLNHNKIIVFFMHPPGSGGASAAAETPSPEPWLAVLALSLLLALAVRGMLVWRDPLPPPRPSQGRLLAGLKAFKDA